MVTYALGSIFSCLCTDCGPVSIHFLLLHQFLLLYWIIQTNDISIPHFSYYPLSLFPFLAKPHSRVFLTSYLSFLLPILSSICCDQTSTTSLHSMVLVKVICNLHLARPNSHVSGLILLSLSIVFHRGGHF